MSKKQEWLTEETLKVHTSIDDNLEGWLKQVNKQYSIVFDQLIKSLKDNIRDIKRDKVSQEVYEARYTTLIMQAQQRTNELGLQMAEAIPEKLQQYATTSYEGMQRILEVSNKFANSLPVYSIEFASGFKYNEYNFQSSVFKSGIRLGDKLNVVLSKGLSEGWDMGKYTEELRKVTHFTVFEANRVARTETARVANEGNTRAMKEYGVERVEWIASLEKRTCQRCQALHTKKFKLGSEPPLPLHPHCRCVLVPVVE